MFSPEEIDAVIAGAQQAVDELAQDVGGLSSSPAAVAAPEPPGGMKPARREARVERNSIGTRPTDGQAAGLHRILSIRVPLIVRLAERSMPLAEILKIAPGSILEFDKPVDADLDLLANNRPIGAGIAVRVNEHYGIQIAAIGSVRERINSLANR